jgi:hypothetical protein
VQRSASVHAFAAFSFAVAGSLFHPEPRTGRSTARNVLHALPAVDSSLQRSQANPDIELVHHFPAGCVSVRLQHVTVVPICLYCLRDRRRTEVSKKDSRPAVVDQIRDSSNIAGYG